MKNKEIERKFLVKELPKDYKKYPSILIIQGYVVITDEGLQVRVRKGGENTYLTIKTPGNLVRDEIKIKITKSQFKALWALTGNRRIEKIRYKIKLGNKIAELDIYKGKLEGLKIVEVEFKSVSEANNFIPPSWFGKEVTYDEHYKNKNLAIYGLP